ncbi:hypothetical protein BREVNS_0793 [Brevinematales bacterium NS]|nr:hypothetical protein BREVNS_0793 [Brevinematales bacterium NS]
MKIAIPLPFFHKHGGIERHTYELVENWKYKHEIHILSYEWEPIEGVHFHRVPGKNLPEIVRRIWFLFYTWYVLRRESWDIILNNGCGQSLIQDIIITASVHKAWMESFRRLKLRRFFLNPLHYLTLFVEWFNYRFHRYKKIICVSRFIQDELCTYHHVAKEDTKVIYLGVNTEEFSLEKRLFLREKARQKYGFGSKEKVLLFPAHEWRRKGIDILLEVLSQLSDDYKLLIVGNPSHREEAFYRKRVLSLELQSRLVFGGLCHTMQEAYAAADVMIFPSTFDAFALVVLEAMSSGLPVITVPTVGASELIRHGGNGFVVKEWNDIRGIKGILELLFSDENFYEKICYEARSTALEWDWKKVVEETENILEEIRVCL